MSNLLEDQIREQERKDRQKGLAITISIMLVLLILSQFWTAVAGIVPPPGEKQYVTTGRIDFGDMTEGRKNINNREKPSETPADRPKTPPVSEPQPVQPKTNPAPPVETVKSTAPSERTVTEPKPSTKPSPEPTTQPTEKTQPKTEPTKTEKQEVSEEAVFTPGGSDHGNNNTAGNRGTPKSPTLDTRGLFSFGEGIGGTNGRSLLEYELPEYKSKQEAKITFEFLIDHTGKVIHVRNPITAFTELADIGKKAVKSFRFSEVDPGSKPQEASVTIIFKLK